MHKTWKKISGVFKHCLVLCAPVSTKRKYLFSALYNSLCDFSDVELFSFSPSVKEACVAERVKSHLSMHCLMHATIPCISINVKSCMFTRSVWPLIFIQLNSTLPNHPNCRVVALGMSPLIGCSLPYLLAHVILLFAFHQVQADPVLR